MAHLYIIYIDLPLKHVDSPYIYIYIYSYISEITRGYNNDIQLCFPGSEFRKNHGSWLINLRYPAKKSYMLLWHGYHFKVCPNIYIYIFIYLFIIIVIIIHIYIYINTLYPNKKPINNCNMMYPTLNDPVIRFTRFASRYKDH